MYGMYRMYGVPHLISQQKIEKNSTIPGKQVAIKLLNFGPACTLSYKTMVSCELYMPNCMKCVVETGTYDLITNKMIILFQKYFPTPNARRPHDGIFICLMCAIFV